jgi:hypothetical protein
VDIAGHLIKKQYKRYKNMYIEAMAQEDSYNGRISKEDMIWYRDSYRRLRDYSIIATGLIYVLNIIDANVFAHFNNFDINDDISLKVSPSIIEPVQTRINYNYYSQQTFGVTMNLNFNNYIKIYSIMKLSYLIFTIALLSLIPINSNAQKSKRKNRIINKRDTKIK